MVEKIKHNSQKALHFQDEEPVVSLYDQMKLNAAQGLQNAQRELCIICPNFRGPWWCRPRNGFKSRLALPMLRYAARHTKPTVLLDFLAPSLITPRRLSSSAPNAGSGDASHYAAFPSHSSDTTTLFKGINTHINLLGRSAQMRPSNPQVEIFNIAVSKLRQTLKDGNLHTAWEQWSVLKKEKMLHFLGQPQLEAYSKLLAVLCPIDAPQQPWVGPDMKAVEEIALVAAAGRAEEALYTCMLVHLQRENSAAVLELYSRYLQLSEEMEVSIEQAEDLEEVEEEQENSEEGLLPSFAGEPTRITQGKVSLILAVVGAHIMQDSLQNALLVSQHVIFRRHQETMNAFLRHFKHDIPFLRKLEDYLHRVEIARWLARPGALSRQTANYSRDHSVVPLERLYSSIIDGLLGPTPYLAANLSAVTAECPVSITESVWTSFLTAFIKCRRFDLAQKLWNDMLKAGVTPKTVIWNSLFEGYDNIGAAQEALSGWESMLAQRIIPNGQTYRALISTLFNAKQPDVAMEKFAMFEKELPKLSTPLESNDILAVYNTVLYGLLAISRDEAAEAIKKKMQTSGPKPDIVTFNTFLQCHARRGNFKAISTTLQELKAAGLSGDVFTFSTILSALLKIGRSDATDVIIQFMKKQGVKPNTATYSAVIDQLVRQQDTKYLREAFNLLRRMEVTPGAEPNDVTYTTILAGIYRGRWLDPAQASDCTQYIWSKMKARNIPLTRATYHILLKACLSNSEPVGLQNALSLYRDMSKRIGLGHDSWYIVLHGLIERGEWAIAQEMVSDMKRSGHQPQGAGAFF